MEKEKLLQWLYCNTFEVGRYNDQVIDYLELKRAIESGEFDESGE